MVKRLLAAAVLIADLGCEGTAPTSSPPGQLSPFSSASAVRHLPSSRSLVPSASTSAIQLVDPATLTVTGLVTFERFGTESSNHEGVVDLDAAMFAERFAGQTLDDANRLFDMLSGTPSMPLTLQAGAINQNLVTTEDAPSNAVVIAGLGPLAFPDPQAVGEGALSVLFKRDQSEVGFSVNGADDGTATVSFFRRDGSLIQTLAIPLPANAGSQTFAFRRLGGVQDIAGLSIQNDDPGGVGYHDFRIAELEGSSEFVPAGQPATVTVAENGQPVAGIDIPAGTFDENVTVTVQFVTTAESAPCHDYLLGQIGRCLQITALTADGEKAINQQPMTAGLCLATDVGPRELFKFEDRAGTPSALRQTMVPFLNCDGFQVGSAAPDGSLKGLAMGLAKRVGRWLSPTPLYAAHGGFGGSILIADGLSYFTWASPLQVSNAGLAVNVFHSGKDAFAATGTFNFTAAGADGATGFTPSTDAITVTIGKSTSTIAAGSFKYSQLFRRWIYGAQTSSGITAMSIEPATGRFTVAATLPSDGALPINKPLSLQIGHRAQGLLLICDTKGVCVPQEPPE